MPEFGFTAPSNMPQGAQFIPARRGMRGGPDTPGFVIMPDGSQVTSTEQLELFSLQGAADARDQRVDDNIQRIDNQFQVAPTEQNAQDVQREKLLFGADGAGLGLPAGAFANPISANPAGGVQPTNADILSFITGQSPNLPGASTAQSQGRGVAASVQGSRIGPGGGGQRIGAQGNQIGVGAQGPQAPGFQPPQGTNGVSTAQHLPRNFNPTQPLSPIDFGKIQTAQTASSPNPSALGDLPNMQINPFTQINPTIQQQGL